MDDEFTLDKALRGEIALGEPNPLTCKQYRVLLMRAFKESNLYNKVHKKYKLDGLKNNILGLWVNFPSNFDVKNIQSEEALAWARQPVTFLVKDTIENVCYRADDLLKKFCHEKLKDQDDLSIEEAEKLELLLQSLNTLSLEELGAQLAAYGITAPKTGNPLSFPRLVMAKFQWSLQPTYPTAELYLRPEMGRAFCQDVKGRIKKLPFNTAYFGPAYVEKLTPGKADDSGSIVIEEFTVVDIHHFFNPQEGFDNSFSEVENEGTINSQILAYWIGKVYSLLTRIGIHEDRLRFRQRFGNELADYAADSWVVEIQCSYDWIECGSIAYRSSHDLQADTGKFGVALIANDISAEPSLVERKLVIAPNVMELGSTFKGNLKMMVDSLLAMNEDEALQMKDALASGEGKEFYVSALGITTVIHQNMVNIYSELIPVERVVRPAVIELSIGIDRIIYCILEHCFYRRPNPSANNPPVNVFRIPPIVAPKKCAVFPVVQKREFEPDVAIIKSLLELAGVECMGSMEGRTIYQRYVTSDRLGVPFAITVIPNNYVTIRDRDSRQKVKVNKMRAASLVKDLIDGRLTWLDLWLRFPHVSRLY